MKTLLICSLLFIGIVAIRDGSSSESEENTKKDVVKPWKKYDWKPREPKFLSEMSKEAKSEFSGIFHDRDLAKGEKNQQMRDWAEKYSMQEEMNEFLASKKADRERQKQERRENYERVGELLDKVDDILDNEKNTWQDAKTQLLALVEEENREVTNAFKAFYPFLEKRHGHGNHGHRFHHGKRFSRHIGQGTGPKHHGIGHGAGPKHHGIGNGAEPGRPRDDFRKSYDPYGNKHGHGY
uniref:DUF148 domain-containing protein n=1 Tax=Caenorhabditis japonica TaxID=281687 RepID=A0A8R1E216_CAEJA